MKNAPNSKSNLDRALQRFAGDFARANELRGQMANAIVAQMIGDGVVKGGSGLRFRYGEKLTRVTKSWAPRNACFSGVWWLRQGKITVRTKSRQTCGFQNPY